MAASGGVPPFRYGRDEAEWDELEDAGLAFLIERARLDRVTSYTEMNTVFPSGRVSACSTSARTANARRRENCPAGSRTGSFPGLAS
jgi:hypothetical protein